MSLSPPNSDRLEETLESARRSVRQAELTVYRARTDLTRLEAVVEEGGGRSDSAILRHEANPATPKTASCESALATSTDLTDVEQPSHEPAQATDSDWQHDVGPLSLGKVDPFAEPLEVASPSPSAIRQKVDADPIVNDAADLSSASILPDHAHQSYRRATSPFMASLMLHGGILLVIVSVTVATIVHNEKQFGVTTLDLGENSIEPLANLDVKQLGELDDAELQNTLSDAPQFDVGGPLVDTITAVDFESVAGPTNLGDMGSLSSPPLDLGTAMTGVGGLGADGLGPAIGLGGSRERRGGGGTRNGGPLGSAIFFGTESKGTRFVFVVDNSSSMKDGRLELALAELVRTVNALTAKQFFYVIFVADQTYPMFYPQPEPDLLPASDANKQRLVTWLPKAILASGKNREMIKAMDMAAALRPNAVYLLWDGDLKYSDKVRTDVMMHLAQPNAWNFVVHTVGLGITSLPNEQNLTAIALAHGGVYRRIDVPKMRTR